MVLPRDGDGKRERQGHLKAWMEIAFIAVGRSLCSPCRDFSLRVFVFKLDVLFRPSTIATSAVSLDVWCAERATTLYDDDGSTSSYMEVKLDSMSFNFWSSSSTY
jgi:hypothetical protein